MTHVQAFLLFWVLQFLLHKYTGETCELITMAFDLLWKPWWLKMEGWRRLGLAKVGQKHIIASSD